MNGAFGVLRYGFCSTERTVNVRSPRSSASRRAVDSSMTVTLAPGTPRSSKSFPLATRTPSTATSVAVNAGRVAASSSMSQ
jgi:hypothetical protein